MCSAGAGGVAVRNQRQRVPRSAFPLSDALGTPKPFRLVERHPGHSFRDRLSYRLGEFRLELAHPSVLSAGDILEREVPDLGSPPTCEYALPVQGRARSPHYTTATDSWIWSCADVRCLTGSAQQVAVCRTLGSESGRKRNDDGTPSVGRCRISE